MGTIEATDLDAHPTKESTDRDPNGYKETEANPIANMNNRASLLFLCSCLLLISASFAQPFASRFKPDKTDSQDALVTIFAGSIVIGNLTADEAASVAENATALTANTTLRVRSTTESALNETSSEEDTDAI